MGLSKDWLGNGTASRFPCWCDVTTFSTVCCHSEGRHSTGLSNIAAIRPASPSQLKLRSKSCDFILFRFLRPVFGSSSVRSPEAFASSNVPIVLPLFKQFFVIGRSSSSVLEGLG